MSDQITEVSATEQALNAAFADVPSFTQIKPADAAPATAQQINDLFSVTATPAVAQPDPSAPGQTASSPQSPGSAGTAPDIVAQLQRQLAESQQQAAYMRGVIESRQPAADTPAAPAKPFVDFTDDPAAYALTREEMTAYNDSIPLVQKIVKASLAGQRAEMATHLNTLNARNQELTGQIAELSRTVGASSVDTFDARLAAAVPELPSVSQSQAWKQYMDGAAPFAGGQTIKDRLVAAYSERNVNVIREYVQDFVAKSGKTQAAPAVSAPPGRTTSAPLGSVPASPGESGLMISEAKIDQMTKLVQAGKMSRETYDAGLSALFAQASSGATLTH